MQVTRTRLLLAAAVLVLLLAGLFLGIRLSIIFPNDSPNSSRGAVVAGLTDQIIMPGVWLGKRFQGSRPLLSLIKRPGSSSLVNSIVYITMDPPLALASIEGFLGTRPTGWKEISTPVGLALVDDDRKIAWLKDPQGNALRIHAFGEPVLNVLHQLQKRPN